MTQANVNSEITILHRQLAGAAWLSAGVEPLLQTLCHQIGPRVPGTQGFAQAQSYLAEELKSAGATISSEKVAMHSWEHGESELELTAPAKRKYNCLQIAHSAAGEASGHLVRVADTNPEVLDRLGSSLKGAIVVQSTTPVSGPTFIPRPVDLKRLLYRGIAGAIVVATYVPGQPEIDIAAVESTLPIPVVGVSPEHSRELAELCHQGDATVRIHTSGRSKPVTCANLIADFTPSGNSDETILLSAHLDTYYLNPGALDNLTGVATVIECARALAPYREKFRRTLRVVIYTGEEYGFCGSKAYVKQHASELDSIRFVYNMDTLWDSTTRGIAVMESPSMRDYLEAHAQAAHRQIDVRDLFCMSSDYLPFLLEGIPCARPAGFDTPMPPWSHTSVDVYENISPDWIRFNAMVHSQLVGAMLRDPAPLPAPHKTPAEIMDVVKKLRADEAMSAYGFECYR